MENKKVAVAYVPVLHEGYRRFFVEALALGAEKIYVVGDDILAEHEELDYLNRKDRIRAIPVLEMQKALSQIISVPVAILDIEVARTLKGAVILPKEDLSTLLKKEYFSDVETQELSIFLRWHRDNSAEEKAIEAHRSVTVSGMDREFMGKALEESQKSFDWWRQIGAVLARNGEVIAVGHNTHMPDEQSPNVHGDPRAVYSRGVNINLTTSAHAEMPLIAEAARKGVSLTGASLYVTEFPCPYCARLIAHSGVAKCYFSKGYAVLDGENIMKDAGVELIFVDMK